MKFGIIGTGMIAHFHARAIQSIENASLHSVFSHTPQRAAEFASTHHCQNASTLEAFLADPDLEIVTIATPSGSHREPTLAALNAGKHVICEKPLEITPERIDLLIAAAQKKNVTLSAILNRRFNQPFSLLKQAVDQGRFGRITLCQASIPWFRSQAYYDSAAWRGTWKFDGGGALMNQAIHTIDQLISAVGPVKRVSATMSCLAHHHIEVEDTAVAIIEFEHGALGTIQASTACWSTTGHPAELHICGTQGSAILSDESFRVWDFLKPTDDDAYVKKNLMATAGSSGIGANDPNAMNFSGHQKNVEHVMHAIQNHTPPTTDAHEARKAVALICAIYESCRNDGQWISL
ncbi:MAG: Gfo/Idh/MocA family oxidoreductase [Verrucomicrobiae bacterium]|nr:Gfo/Idh/MocA family oxidoreductase [Verrucomicrobiae bacterium]NNJ44319.1 Gfo/Idh/MocA family oxidoreductase [Akkermansiaceae bacterium]